MREIVRCGMHSSYCQVIKIIMGKGYPTDQDCYNAAHIEILCYHIAEYTKEISQHDFSDLALRQEPKLPKHVGAH